MMLADGGTLSGPGFLWGLPAFGAIFVLVAVVVLAKVSGRLLGIKFGWRRAITAGFTGFVIGWFSTWSLGGQKHRSQSLSWQGVFFSGLIATMLIAATLELLARPGRLAEVEGKLRGIPRPFRSLRQRARRSLRYLQVTRIAARHGLSSYLGGRLPGTQSAPLTANARPRSRKLAAFSSSSARSCPRGPTCCRRSSSPSCPACRSGFRRPTRQPSPRC